MNSITTKPSSLEVNPPDHDLESKAIEVARKISSFADCELVNMTLESGHMRQEAILSGQLVQVLQVASNLLSQGLGVSVIPKHQELTTAQAANLLNVSRPHVVKLLEEGGIPHRKVGKHRRIYAEDVMNYKNDIDAKRMKTLDKLAEESQKLGIGY